MRSFWAIPTHRLFLLFLTSVLLVACGSNTSPLIISPQPSNTVAPTAIVLQATPTITPTLLTSTPAPTLAEVNFSASGDGPTPTNPLGSTFTPAPPTLTMTAAPTLFGLEIVYFTSTSQIISPGDNVTLFWQVKGAEKVTVFRLDEEGNPDLERPVEADGRITLRTNPENLTAANFLLLAEQGNNSIEETLSISVNCSTAAWFFAPSPNGCPTGPATLSTQAQQRFEGGLMVWVESVDSIFVFYNDSQVPRWVQLEDTFEEGMAERDENLISPPDRQQPIRGFGLIWRTTPRVQERLGWAIENEGGYAGALQSVGPPEAIQTIYLRIQDGSVLELAADGTEWRILPVEILPTATPAE